VIPAAEHASTLRGKAEALLGRSKSLAGPLQLGGRESEGPSLCHGGFRTRRARAHQLTGSRRDRGNARRLRLRPAGSSRQDPRRLTGNLVLRVTGTASDIVAGQIKSLSLPSSSSLSSMALMFCPSKSLPRILPKRAVHRHLLRGDGMTRVFLNLGNGLIAAIALGIAVDSTDHYMARLSIELKGPLTRSRLWRRRLRIRRISDHLRDSGSVRWDFYVCLASLSRFSSSRSCRDDMATALAANLILLPALLATTNDHYRLGLALRQARSGSGAAIPLFAGLRPAQARIVVLMGEIRRFAPGDPIIRAATSETRCT